MNKLIKSITIMAVIYSLSPISGKAQSFTKESGIISAGIGLGSSLYSGTGSGRPAISANFEKGMWETGDFGVISLGGYIGNTGYKDTYRSGSYLSEYKWNYTIVGARSAFHYSQLNNDKFDVYGGLMLSYNIVSYKYTDNDPYYDYDYGNSSSSGIGLTGYVGGRYNFSEKLAVYTELGYGVSTLSFGLSFRL